MQLFRCCSLSAADSSAAPLPWTCCLHTLLQGFEGLTQRISDYQAQREERAAAVKAEEAAKQLRECSFAPDINRHRVEAKVGWWEWVVEWEVGGSAGGPLQEAGQP